jgi:FAD/FMN-containing dehydrogenase
MSLTDTLAGIVGAAHVITDPDVLDGRSVYHARRYRGHASALVRPGSAVAAVLRVCREAGAYVTVQGGRTSLVAGTVPEHDDVLLSTERLRDVGEVDAVERRIHVGAGATLAEVQRAAAAAGLMFGVDLAARDSATVGGMASTNAGGLRSVRYGNMGEQVLGLDVALPRRVAGAPAQPGSPRQHRLRPRVAVHRRRGHVGRHHRAGSAAASDPGASGHAICGFDDLDALVETGRAFRDMDGIAALELIDARASALTAEHVGVAAPVTGAWRARRIRPAAEIRCVPAVVGDRGVCGRVGRAGRQVCSRRHSRAVRSYRRRQPAPESGAACAQRRPRARSAFRLSSGATLVPARHRVSAVGRRVVGALAGMPTVGLEPERPFLELFLGQEMTGRPLVA